MGAMGAMARTARADERDGRSSAAEAAYVGGMGSRRAEMPAGPRRRPALAAFASLREHRFRAWFLTQVLSASGTMTQSVAASWLVLQLTGHAVDLGYLAAVTIAPTTLLGAYAGSITDRVDRRRLLLATQTSLVVLGVALAVVTATGRASLTAVLLVSGLTGVVTAVDNPTRQVFVLDLVGRERLASAVSLYEVVLNASRVLGPAAGGAVLALSGPAACFALNAATYVPPIVVLLLLGARTRDVPRRPRQRASVVEGMRAAWSDRVVRSAWLLAVCTGGIFNVSVVYPVLAQVSFHLGPSGYGLLVASFGVGALPGALAAASREVSGRSVRLLALATGAAVVLTSAAPDPGLAFLGMGLVGLTSIWFIASANTLVQLRAPAHLRGRIMGVWTIALPGMIPITGPLIAALIDATSPRWGYAAVGLSLALTAAMTGRWLTSGADTDAP